MNIHNSFNTLFQKIHKQLSASQKSLESWKNRIVNVINKERWGKKKKIIILSILLVFQEQSIPCPLDWKITHFMKDYFLKYHANMHFLLNLVTVVIYVKIHFRTWTRKKGKNRSILGTLKELLIYWDTRRSRIRSNFT